MRVLVACEYSGAVRGAFRRRGHDAWSCDLLPAEDNHSTRAYHMQGNVLGILDQGWDMMIAFPPCTHLCSSGARWFKEKRADGRQQESILFFKMLAHADIPQDRCRESDRDHV